MTGLTPRPLPRSRCRVSRFAALLVAAVAAAAVLPTAAQSPSLDPRTPGDFQRMGLEPQPLAIESLGLQFHRPAGSSFHLQRLEGRTTVNLVDGADIPTWSIRVQPLISNLPRPTPAAQVQQMLESWQRAGQPADVISNEVVTIGPLTGQLCYVRQQSTGGEPVISGWLMLPLADRELLVFAIQTLPTDFGRTRALLGSSFSTIELTPLTDVAQARKAKLDAGRDFLAAATAERLRSLIGRERWYRYYMPAAVTGVATDTELGYYLLEFSEGKLGAIDPSQPESNYDPTEQTFGLLVHVHGHYLESGSDSTYDSQAYYWMAWDQSQEAWSIRGTRRHRGRELSEALTGIRTPKRTGDPYGTLTIINSGSNAASRDQRSWRVPEAYMSQPIRWALGVLMPRQGGSQLNMNTYCFDNTGGRMSVSLRSDAWAPASEGAGRWRLKSQTRSEGALIESVYDETGELRRRNWPNGPVTELVELADLHRIWKDKGLATGKMTPDQP
ncbi:MAG: hypothetical protein GY715_06735 [Planctomycetes bacterium]|nr:hypothetical protein [Planctomycetota bacterium]